VLPRTGSVMSDGWNGCRFRDHAGPSPPAFQLGLPGARPAAPRWIFGTRCGTCPDRVRSRSRHGMSGLLKPIPHHIEHLFEAPERRPGKSRISRRGSAGLELACQQDQPRSLVRKVDDLPGGNCHGGHRLAGGRDEQIREMDLHGELTGTGRVQQRCALRTLLGAAVDHDRRLEEVEHEREREELRRDLDTGRTSTQGSRRCGRWWCAHR
jgi:hypothetical protein